MGCLQERTAQTTFGACSQSTFITRTTGRDPYRYQVGFGNFFNSEAVPGVIPEAQNTPQVCKYGLYSEQLTSEGFIAPRSTAQHVWFYRILPGVVQGIATKLPHNLDLESRFATENGNVEFVPHGLCWQPFPLPSDNEQVDFVQGLKTIAGNGDATTKEGVAIHIYTANVSMRNRAFCSHDGDMLFLPQQGRIEIQTELGMMMVRPGELAVIQAGIKFKISLPDGPSRGYVQEIFGTHYELPDMGPIGTNGMALPRNFKHPVASFDRDLSEWEIVVKLAGKLWYSKQNHTPFDVVAWHGNCVPYKYGLENFINTAVVDRDQSDPSVYTVLTAKSKIPNVAISELMAFTPKWNVSTNTFRPPYYHRNMACEIMGLIYGPYCGSSRKLAAGGLSYQSSYTPHGETYETYKKATEAELKPERGGEGVLAFMFHIPTHIGLTKYALERSGVLDEPVGPLFNTMKPNFMDHTSEVNEDLTRMGLPPLGTSSWWL
ncbi:homogentisate 1,2-dioxygenase [Pseudomassariella vexata]|uniref:homogentisate 1,2-dioxygenase n=1 Tax=Pseudomassariella vexata TaxID=1141098 RepID=A0A1Y2DV59_9PEZI|nr:homogentisate 1,2-dioxygenase [Pseudomassariella vexata]ORY63172.1 homogentisate 1,2-dioxygenase [Pseudomassariella vexata]